MIPKHIPTVHRFIPFFFALVCAILPNFAFAATSQTFDTVTSGGITGASSAGNTHLSSVFSGASAPSGVFYYTASYTFPYDNSVSSPNDVGWACGLNGSGGSYNSSTNTATFNGVADSCIPNTGNNVEIPGHDTFYFCVANLLVGGSSFWRLGDHGVGDQCFQYKWNGTNYGAVNATGDTEITTVSPYDKQTIATSSLPWNYETTGNVLDTDYKSGTRLAVKIDRNTDQQAVGALNAVNSAFGNTTYLPISSAGSFDVATTDVNNQFGVDRLGLYTMTQQIQTPGLGIHWWIFNFDFTYNTLVATTTTFTVGTTTAIDNLQLTGSAYLNNVASSTGDALASCQFNWWESAVDFSIGSNLLNCMGGLTIWAFVPSPGAIASSIQQLQTGLLTRAPWGYVTRLVTIMQSNATSTLPTFSAPIYLTGTSTPDFVMTFDEGDMLDGGAALLGSIKANGTDLNIEDITKPWIQLFVAITALIIIFTDLMGMGRDSIERDRGEGGRHNVDPSAYREWLYNNRKK